MSRLKDDRVALIRRALDELSTGSVQLVSTHRVRSMLSLLVGGDPHPWAPGALHCEGLNVIGRASFGGVYDRGHWDLKAWRDGKVVERVPQLSLVGRQYLVEVPVETTITVQVHATTEAEALRLAKQRCDGITIQPAARDFIWRDVEVEEARSGD